MFGIKIIDQNCEGLVEHLGKYSHTVDSGLHFYLPFIERIRTISMAMRPLKLPKYVIITKDNAEITTSVTLNFHVTDAVKYEYENTDSVESMAQLVRGHLRDIIGRMELNEVLGSTAHINADLATTIGDLTNTYGINVDRINIDELTPSPAIQDAMDKQLTADRQRQASISQAEGNAKSIELNNQAQNDALIATANANAKATVTNANANAQAQVANASAAAQATKLKADAEKYRIATVNGALATADAKYFENQSINAFNNIAGSTTNLVVTDGENTKSFGQIKAAQKVWDQGK